MTPRIIRSFLFAGFIVFLLPACHREPHFPEGVVATLAGNPVSSEELRETARFIGLGKLSSRPLDIWSPVLASLVFRETIYDRLLIERASKNQIEVSSEEISRERERLTEASAPSRSNTPYVPPDRLIRRKLLLEKSALSVAPEPDVTLRQLKTDYQQNHDRFTVPEQALVKDIVVRSEEEGKAILAALATGNSFSALAKVKSLAPEGKSGGLLPPFAMGQMPSPFNRVFSMKPGEISSLISSPYGYHILKLVAIRPSHVKPFSSVKEKIRKQIIAKNRRKALEAWFTQELHSHPVVVLPHYRYLLSFQEG